MSQRFDDSKLLNPQTVDYYVNTNAKHLTGPAKALILEFPGLGGGSCLGGKLDRGDYGTSYAIDMAHNGILLAYLFPGPWSWGNKGATRMADACIGALAEKYELGENFPLALCGGSMGSVGAMMCAVKTKYPLRAVALACPCVDAVESLYKTPNFPRTWISAAAVYDMPLEDALAELSAKNHIEEFPSVPYFISCDGEDEVFPQQLCDEFVEALRQRGLDVAYHPQPGLCHGQFTLAVRNATHEFLKASLL